MWYNFEICMLYPTLNCTLLYCDILQHCDSKMGDCDIPLHYDSRWEVVAFSHIMTVTWEMEELCVVHEKMCMLYPTLYTAQ